MPVILTCRQCGSAYLRRKCEVEGSKYCSRLCHNRAISPLAVAAHRQNLKPRKIVTTTCMVCQTIITLRSEYERKKGRGKYCSFVCMGKARAASSRSGVPYKKNTIPLTKGKVAVVSSADYDYVNQWTWYAHSQGYAARKPKHQSAIFLHRALVERMLGRQLKENGDVDHRDRDRLNNRRSNLRLCTSQQNSANSSLGIRNRSGFKGVHWNETASRWVAQTKLNGRTKHLGCFLSAEDAARAYDRAVLKEHGAFAYLNFPAEVAVSVVADTSNN
jgi:HNH endonuclease/AP2 domain